MSDVDGDGALFENAMLTGASLQNASLRGADFSNADLAGADIAARISMKQFWIMLACGKYVEHQKQEIF